MPADSDPAEGLYNLFLMGLTWLREDNPDVLARRGASVFSSFEHATPVFKSARRLTEMSWELMELVCALSIVHEAEKPPGKRELRQIIAESEMHNIVLVSPQSELTPQTLFGASDCRHVITDAGMAHAMQVTAPYAEIVNRDTFLQGWRKYKVGMTSLNTKRRRASQQGDDGTERADVERGEESRYIAPATLSEEDFDW